MWPPRRVDGMPVRHPFTLASDRANRARTKINRSILLGFSLTSYSDGGGAQHIRCENPTYKANLLG